jgi:hypothetical protein
MLRVVAVKHWANFVVLLLIVVTLIIVIAPYFDLPPTLARCSTASQKASVTVFTAIIPASINLLPQNFKGAPVQAVIPGSGDSTVPLIDLNCTRLC